MNGQSLLIQAFVYLAAGVISVPIAKRLGLGSVLGYLIAGVVIGPFAMGLVGEQADVMRFAEFGVVILLFLIGLEVRPALLWSMRATIFGLGGAQVIVTAAVLGAATLLFGLDWRSAVAVGFILAMSSTAIVLQTLDEKGLRQGPVGRAAFGVLLFQDLAVIPLFALLPLLATGAPTGAEAAGHGSGLLSHQPGWIQAIAVLAAVGAVVGGGRYLVRPVFRFIAAARLREIFTASALLLVIAVAVLMEMVGLSPALGAFLAGVVLAESEFRRELETDIEPFRGLLLGLFFITVGASLNFAVVMKHPAALLGAVATVLLVKGAVMYGAARTFRMTRGDAAATATSLSQVGEFAFVLLTFTGAAGVLAGATTEFLTAVVALSMATTPLAMAVYEKLASIRGPAPPPTPEQYPFETGAPDAIIAGFGRFGQVVGRLLSANRFKTVVLDVSIEHIDLLRRYGRRVHYGDASRLDLLRSAGAQDARLLVVAIDDRDKTTEIVEIARQAFPNIKILARAWDRRHAYELLSAGADHVERETFESALAMGLSGLRSLGVGAGRAAKAAEVFRKHDLQALKALAPATGDEEKYALAIRDSQQTMDRLLAADMAALRAEDGDPDDLPWADEDLSSYDYSLVPPGTPADPDATLRDAIPEGSA